VSRQDQADIINDPKTTVNCGINANGRPVDHYHRDGTTVITEQGRPIQRGTGKPASPVPNGGPYERLR